MTIVYCQECFHAKHFKCLKEKLRIFIIKQKFKLHGPGPDRDLVFEVMCTPPYQYGVTRMITDYGVATMCLTTYCNYVQYYAYYADS